MKRMKHLLKKVLVPLTALSLIFGMTALANSSENPAVPGGSSENPSRPSGSAENPQKPDANVEGSTVIDGKKYPVVIANADAAANESVSTPQKIISLMGANYTPGTTVTLLGIIDASLPDGVMIPAGGSVRITFSVPGVKTGDIIKILHRKHDGSWETLSTTTGEAAVSANFTELSPVAFVKVTGTDTTKGYDTNKSPRTGR